MQSVILGTAQWGSDYGITNTVGRPPDDELARLAAFAREHGIDRLDTAPAYGDAESRISTLGVGFAVQTKAAGRRDATPGVLDSVQASLTRMGRQQVEGVLVHDWPTLNAGERDHAIEVLCSLRAVGVLASVGVSVYTEADLEGIGSEVDVVQVPASALDQRLEGSQVVADLRARGVRIQARSVFLQGVAVAHDPSGSLGPHPDLERLHRTAEDAAVDPVGLCLGWVRTRDWIDEVVLAATTTLELEGIWCAWSSPPPDLDWAALGSIDVDLIDPRRWPARPRGG